MQGPLRDRVRRWIFDDALPFWATNGLDAKHGGYVEKFHSPDLTPFFDKKRVRVVARQIYVFSHAATLGFAKGERCARHGVEFLTRSAWQGANKGWARALARDGSVVDSTPDLYDQAFVLFALAWFHRASRDPHAIELADQTIDVIESVFRTPAGGFAHEIPLTGHRQQNPHMHLLEAMLALHETAPNERYASLAEEIIGLFRTRFFDKKLGVLREFFDDDWRPAPGDAGRLTEPGHQFEWAWILLKAGRLFDTELSAEARKLISFAEQHGVNLETGVVYQQVRDDGAPIDRGSRTWPNTERLKAAAALYELDGVDPRPIFNESCGVLFDRYLATATRGIWTEKFDADGAPIDGDVPASTFYHLFLAFSEVLRILDSLDDQD